MKFFSVWARDEGSEWHHIFTHSRKDGLYLDRLALASSQFDAAREAVLHVDDATLARVLGAKFNARMEVEAV